MSSRQIQPEDFGLSKQQFDDIKQVFDQFDTDASGAMATSDVAAAMRKLGQPVEDEDEVLGMTIGTVDPDSSGHIGLNEFLVIMTQSHLGWGDQAPGDDASMAQTHGGAKQQMQQSQVHLPPELAAEDQAVQDFLRILDEHRRHCEREGKYLEAETAARRLKELRQHEENRRREAMRSRQTA